MPTHETRPPATKENVAGKAVPLYALTYQQAEGKFVPSLIFLGRTCQDARQNGIGVCL